VAFPRTGNPNRLRPIRRLLTLALFLDVLVLLEGLLARRLVDLAMGPEGPFTVAMADGLHRLGVIVLVGGFLAEVVQEAAKIALYATAVHDGHPFAHAGYLIDFWWLLTGFAIVGFAAVIRHGCALRDELAEVI
jgi:hypothetical protein